MVVVFVSKVLRKVRNTKRNESLSNTKLMERHLPAHAGEQAVLNHNGIVALLLVLSSRAILHTVTDPQTVKAKCSSPITTSAGAA